MIQDFDDKLKNYIAIGILLISSTTYCNILVRTPLMIKKQDLQIIITLLDDLIKVSIPTSIKHSIHFGCEHEFDSIFESINTRLS